MKNLLLTIFSFGAMFANPTSEPSEEWLASTRVQENSNIIDKNRIVAKSRVQLGAGGSLIYFFIPWPSLSLKYRAPIYQNPAYSSNGYANRFSINTMSISYESLAYKTPTLDSSAYKGYGFSVAPQTLGCTWVKGHEYGLQSSGSSSYSEFQMSVYTVIPRHGAQFPEPNFPLPIISVGYEIGYTF